MNTRILRIAKPLMLGLISAATLSLSSGATIAASSDAACAPLAVTKLVPSRATANGDRYRMFVAGVLANKSGSTYTGAHKGAEPTQYQFHARDARGKVYQLGSSVETRMMRNNAEKNIWGEKSVNIKNRALPNGLVTFSAYVYNLACEDHRRRYVESHFTYDLRPVKLGKAPKLIGKPRISYAGAR